ncbi:MAG: hypothetical protein U1E45_19725 [Geminicoccaceae bacterium]
MVGGAGLAIALLLIGLVGFGIYDHYRENQRQAEVAAAAAQKQQELETAVAAAKEQARAEVERAKAESALKDQIITSKDQAIDALAKQAPTAGTATVTAALD